MSKAIIDLETKTKGAPDAEIDEIQLVGIKDVGGQSFVYCWPKDEDKIRKHLQRVNTLIGYNLRGYDVPILERYNLIGGRHIIVDLLITIKRREPIMEYEFTSKALGNVLKVLGLSPKTDLPIATFQKPQDEWTAEERLTAYMYLENDLKIEEELYLWLDEYFSAWKEWLPEDDIRRHAHLLSTSGAYTYKAICHAANMKEEYNSGPSRNKQYEGGLVVEPTRSKASGNIICLDFASMYPHAFMQANLYSHHCRCCTMEERWDGGDFFELEGRYCTKRQGIIEGVIKRLYHLRQEYKAKKDKREYAIKIIINTMYGISGSSKFKNVFNLHTAADCTHIGRRCLEYARETLEGAGYEVLYSDTDSCYVICHDSEDALLGVVDGIVSHIKGQFPFPEDTFNLKIDDRIKHMWFFKRGDHYKKKHYAYVKQDDKVVIKGLPIIKRDVSKLGKLLLKKHIIPGLKEGLLRRKVYEWREIINNELEEDPTVAGKHFYLKTLDGYKDERCLPALLSQKYGPGRIFLIPNRVYGVGKSVRYCTIEEFRERKISPNAMILNKTYGELDEFTEGSFSKRYANKKSTGQVSLWDF